MLLLWATWVVFLYLIDFVYVFEAVPNIILIYTGLLITNYRRGGGFQKRASGSNQSILFEPTACQNLDFDFESIL